VTPVRRPGRRLRWSWLVILALSLAAAALTPAAAAATGPDADGDGLADAFEAHSGGLLDPTRGDTDGDGVVDDLWGITQKLPSAHATEQTQRMSQLGSGLGGTRFHV